MDQPKQPIRLRPIPALIFASRWLQLPLYLGLIVAQGVYVYQFWQELVHLLSLVWTGRAHQRNRDHARRPRLDRRGHDRQSPDYGDRRRLRDLRLAPVSGRPSGSARVALARERIGAQGKLATAIIGISSIHLLKTFINAEHLPQHVIMWQVVIHLTFLVSALAISATDRLLARPETLKAEH
jgi:uncharacterized membrane protein YqhA